MVENVFVVGLDDHNAGILDRLPDAGRYRFHPLLSVDELLYRDTIPMPDLLDTALRQIECATLGGTRLDVDEDEVAELLLDGPLGHCCADVAAGADDCDLRTLDHGGRLIPRGLGVMRGPRDRLSESC